MRPTAGLLCLCNAVRGPTSLLDCPTTEACSCCFCMFGLLVLGQSNIQGKLQVWTAGSSIQAANVLLSSLQEHQPLDINSTDAHAASYLLLQMQSRCTHALCCRHPTGSCNSVKPQAPKWLTRAQALPPPLASSSCWVFWIDGWTSLMP